jgi:hypothetical protein
MIAQQRGAVSVVLCTGPPLRGPVTDLPMLEEGTRATRALGIEVPPGLLSIADEVIE